MIPITPPNFENSVKPIASHSRNNQLESADSADFKSTLQHYLKQVNDMQGEADESIQKMAAGQISDVHQVMNTVQQANVAFNMMMEIRNKVVDAYQELMRMRF